MGIGFNEGFSMNLTLTGGGARTGGTFDRVSGMDYDDAFTEDDFDFFDRPSNIKPAPIPFPAPPRTSNLNAVVAASSAGFPTAISPSLLGDGFQSSGPGPPTMTPGPHSSPWTFGEGFTPNVPHDGAPSAPENLPSTPGESAMHSVPTTPTVNLVHEFDHHPTNAKRLAEFDPIPFASTHRISDGKYTMGKFALPSPPDEEDGTESTLDASPNDDGWKIRYNACTDPRVGVVKKLLGVKRKILDQGMRVSRKLPSWLTDYDDAEVGNGDLMDDAKSEKDSEDDLDNTHGSQPTSHLSAPLPSYLPLGPHLIQTQFHHSQLLPLCLPSKAPGSSIPPTNIAVAAPINVPTPVSPAAMIGAASEKSRSLETTASIIAKEVVENSLWGDVWLTNVVGSTVHGELCHADISAVQRSLADIDYIEGPVDLTTLSELSMQPNPQVLVCLLTSISEQVSPPRKQTLQELRPPLITVGKGDAVVQVLPTALRFWEKLGLSPRGGRKDVDAFVLFEADGEERIQQVKSWLTCFSAAYAVRNVIDSR
jgi:mediator of RNA polymerase II transcription subunit 13